MIREALQYLTTLNEHALSLRPAPGAPTDDPRHLHFDKAGEFLTVELPPPPREHQVDALDSYAGALARFAGEAASTWVSLDMVTGVLNDAAGSHRVDVVTMPLQPHHAFDVLRKHCSWASQEAIVNLLRHDLTDVTLDPQTLLQAVRKLKFAMQSEATGEFTATSAKLGKQVASQVTGEVDLPETVSVEFHPYPAFADDLEVSVVVFCTLFTDPGKGLLRLAPQPGQLEAAERKAKTALAERLEEMTGRAVFVGVP